MQKKLTIKQLFVFTFILFFSIRIKAQHFVDVQIPDMSITADKIKNGDGDTYGVGDWYCETNISLNDATLSIKTKIIFHERANDFSVIVGYSQQQIVIEELKKCTTCKIELENTKGNVAGPNIGARGYRNYKGDGIIESARIVTDVFGIDAGQIGGRIKFVPLRIYIKCLYASAE